MTEVTADTETGVAELNRLSKKPNESLGQRSG